MSRWAPPSRLAGVFGWLLQSGVFAGSRRARAPIVMVACVVAVLPIRAATSEEAIQITDNDLWDDSPAISGDNVVWTATSAATPFGDAEIYLWDGSTITNISNSAIDDRMPDVSGSNVVWRAGPSNDHDVMLWDGTQTIALTDDGGFKGDPVVDSGRVVWSHQSQIMVYDGSSTTAIAGTPQVAQAPRLHGERIVFRGRQSPNAVSDIYLWNGTGVEQLTFTSTSERDPDVSGDQLAWLFCTGPGSACDQWEIYRSDGQVGNRITETASTEGRPRMSGSYTVWSAHDGNDSEIFFHNGARTFQLTDNEVTDIRPDISGKMVVWSGWDGNDFEIFMTRVPEGLEAPLLSPWGVAAVVALIIAGGLVRLVPAYRRGRA